MSILTKTKTKKNNLVWKYEAGDKKSIFGKPYTYNGTKWIPDEGVKTDNKGREKVGANVSAKDADKYLKDNGLEHIDMLSTKSIRRLFDHHGIDWRSMSPKERLNELIKLYGGTGTKPLTETQKKGLIESLSVKEYACKGASTTLSKQDIQQIEQSAAPRKGRHWGSSKSTNNTAKMVAFSSANVFRPIDKDLREHNFHIDEYTAERAIALRKYAQERMSQVSRTDHPHIMRGMSLPEDQVRSIIEGKQKNIELTGCTAFTFHKAVRDRYATSSWTKSFGANKVGVKIMLERDDDVDKSIGMWHNYGDQQGHRKTAADEKKPAFEVLSGLECITVTKVEYKKPPTLDELQGKYEKTMKASEKKRSKELTKVEGLPELRNTIRSLVKGSTPLTSNMVTGMFADLHQGKSKQDLLKSVASDPRVTLEHIDMVIRAFKSISEKGKKWIVDNPGAGMANLNEDLSGFDKADRKYNTSKGIVDAVKIIKDSKVSSDVINIFKGRPGLLQVRFNIPASEAYSIHYELFERSVEPILHCKAGRYKEES